MLNLKGSNNVISQNDSIKIELFLPRAGSIGRLI